MISQYEVVARIGGGGMGVVYKATDMKLGRAVALKFLPPQWSHDEGAKQRFLREAQAASATNHRNICIIHDIAETDDGRLFIVMAYYEGQTLKQKLEAGPLPADEALEIAADVAEGLAQAHARRVIHRDVKPGNLMITDDGVKVLDFGLAKFADSLQLTMAGSTIGTVAYMSPEQARSEEADERSDVWAVGVVLYEMLTGRVPFKGAYPEATFYAIKNDPVPPLSAAGRDISPAVEALVLRALEKDPDRRYQTSRELVRDLRHLQGRTVPLALWPMPRRMALTAIVVSLFAVAAAITYEFWPIRELPRSIAVIPFEIEPPDPDLDYLSEGISESLIDDLSQLKDVAVISRASSFRYAHGTDIQQIGKSLGVDAVLIGRVVRRPTDIVISAELVAARDGRHLWGTRLISAASQLPAVESDLAVMLADDLRPRLAPPDRAALARQDTSDPQAYELFLRGRYHWNRRTPADLAQSLEYFQQAIARDSNYALAYVGLADTYLVMWRYTGGDWRESNRQAKSAALKAVELNPMLPEAHASLGGALVNLDRDYAAAERQFARAIELKPSYSTARQFYAQTLSEQGRHQEALAQIRLALQTDPMSLTANGVYGDVLVKARRYDDAIQQLKKTIAIDSGSPLPYGILARAWDLTGRYQEAIDAAARERILIGEPEQAVTHRAGLLKAALREGGERKYWEQRLQLALTPDPPGPPLWYEAAAAAARLGRTDVAVMYLERAYREGDVSFPYVRIDPEFDDLRGDPRVTALLNR